MGRMNRTARFLAMITIAMLAQAQSVMAQRSTGRRVAAVGRKKASIDHGRTGFNVGVHTIAATGITISGDMEGTLKTNFGPGAGLSVGYGFNRTFSGFASVDVAKQGTSGSDYEGSFGLTHFELGMRANLPYGSTDNVPYVSASVGSRALSARVVDAFDGEEYDLSLSGMMFGLGGGVQHAISPTLSLDGGADIGFGRFGKYDADGERGSMDVNGSTSIRFRFGLTWRPRRAT